MPSAFAPQWLARLLAPPYEPSLIDLGKYEGQLLVSKARGRTLMPPPTTPGLVRRNWTLAESEAMRVNRREAEAIYDWVAQLRITDPQGVARKHAALLAKRRKERKA